MPGGSNHQAEDVRVATVESTLLRIFPNGTDPHGGGLQALEAPSDRPDIGVCPIFPTDLFAAAAYLLEASGAYQFIVAPADYEGGPNPDFVYDGPTQPLDPVIAKEAAESGLAWREGADHGSAVWVAKIAPLWAELIKLGGERLVPSVEGRKKTQPKWWAIAHTLLIIADEASAGLGYTHDPTTAPWFNAAAQTALLEYTKRERIPSSNPGPAISSLLHDSRHVAVDSLCFYADRDVVRVLPKGRTTPLGCTMRTLSHNLALLPGHGGPNAYWHQPYQGLPDDVDAKELNLLLVPYPFIMPENSFRVVKNKPDGSRSWGRFRVDQRWLNPDGVAKSSDGKRWSDAASRTSLVNFVDCLIAKAKAKVGKIHGVVFPEYALDWDSYDEIVRHIAAKYPYVEFVTSGVSMDCQKRPGNQVVSSIFRREQTGTETTVQIETHSRRKHHRWRITRSQIKDYDLKELDENLIWWEYLEIEERVLHVDVFREGSTFTSVICEDIARVDPGMSMLRALGPNLVFALLMDGPQIASRWPGAYATSLADDPGSSVLTFTSAALVDRSCATRKRRDPTKKSSRSVALWKNYPNSPEKEDTAKSATSMDLDEQSYGIVLCLTSERAMEATLDERKNTDATAWIYDEGHPYLQVPLSDAEIDGGGWRWITNGPRPTPTS